MDRSVPAGVQIEEPRWLELRRAQIHCQKADVDRLVDGLRSADPRAHAELCRQFGPPIHRFVARRLRGDEHLAEELMLQTLLDAVRNIRHFNPRRAFFSAWLFGIARRHVQRELRRQRRRGSVPASAQVPIHTMPEQGTKEDLAAVVTARIEAQRQVAKLRNHLSDIEMEVLLLHCMDELSLREIAQIARRSERAIKSLLYRARQKARESLVNDDD